LSWVDDILGKSIALVGTIVGPRRGVLNFSAAFDVTDNPETKSTDVDIASSVGAWQSYTPVLSGSDPVPSLGAGTLEGRWRMNGPDSIEIAISLAFAADTSLQASPHISLPPGWLVDASKLPGGLVANSSVYLADASTPANNHGGRVLASSSTVQVNPTGTSGVVSATIPFTWANGDLLLIAALLPVTVDT
jgi:hypothetical protein